MVHFLSHYFDMYTEMVITNTNMASKRHQYNMLFIFEWSNIKIYLLEVSFYIIIRIRKV